MYFSTKHKTGYRILLLKQGFSIIRAVHFWEELTDVLHVMGNYSICHVTDSFTPEIFQVFQ